MCKQILPSFLFTKCAASPAYLRYCKLIPLLQQTFLNQKLKKYLDIWRNNEIKQIPWKKLDQPGA